MKTNKGIVPIRGKQYKTVALRVAEFRQANPTATISTELMSASDDRVVMKATIIQDGNVIATGWAEETRNSSNINATSALENCETSSVGRALAFYGMAGEELEIASADEVINAISQQNGEVESLIEYIHAIDEHFDFVASIKSAIANEEWDTLRCIIEETDNDVKKKFARAYTKGGVFTTHETKCMKVNPTGA